MNHREERAGFIKLVVYLILIIVIASVVFKVDFEKLSKNEQLKKNADFVKAKAVVIWKESLSQPFMYFWNNLALNFASQAVSGKEFKNPFEDMMTPPLEMNSTQTQEESFQKTYEGGAYLP